ncbi:MAG: hypothetical protein JOZ99_09315 [Actinobacteria bacterium]|nr:hypothetical protein [Actinomycetota bacterium]
MTAAEARREPTAFPRRPHAHEHEQLLAAVVALHRADAQLEGLSATERHAAELCARALALHCVDLAQLSSMLRTHTGRAAIDALVTKLEPLVDE